MSRILKYIVLLAVLVLLYFSFDIRKLDEYNNSVSSVEFNAAEYARKFWDETREECIASAPDINKVLAEVTKNPSNAFSQYGRKIGISSTYYFMVNGEGMVKAAEDEYVLVQLPLGEEIKVATAFIFGNAVRDGSGKVDINDFLNMTDFNAVSIEINSLIREEVVPGLTNTPIIGKYIKFTGAMELHEDNYNLDELLLIPLSCELSHAKK